MQHQRSVSFLKQVLEASNNFGEASQKFNESVQKFVEATQRVKEHNKKYNLIAEKNQVHSS